MNWRELTFNETSASTSTLNLSWHIAFFIMYNLLLTSKSTFMALLDIDGCIHFIFLKRVVTSNPTSAHEWAWTNVQGLSKYHILIASIREGIFSFRLQADIFENLFNNQKIRSFFGLLYWPLKANRLARLRCWTYMLFSILRVSAGKILII